MIPADTQKQLEWLTDVLAVHGRILTLEDTRLTVREWDSMGDLMLLTHLEEDFGIVVSADDLAAMSSAREIFSLLERNNALPAG